MNDYQQGFYDASELCFRLLADTLFGDLEECQLNQEHLLKIVIDAPTVINAAKTSRAQADITKWV